VPALPPVPKTLRFDNFFSYAGDLHAKCRFFMSYSGSAPTNSDLNSLGVGLQARVAAFLAPLMNAEVTWLEVTITDLSSPTSAVATYANSTVGTRAGAALPADTCLLESRHVSRRFRGGHPRIYWPFGCAPDLQDAQHWTNAFASAAATGLVNFYTGVEASVWSGGGVLAPVNPSFYSGFTVHMGVTGRARNVSTPRAVPLIDPITGSTIQVALASQRRRLLRLA